MSVRCLGDMDEACRFVCFFFFFLCVFWVGFNEVTGFDDVLISSN